MALLYERAVSMHKATCEKVFVVEQAVMADENRLDPTWQETLNHATCKDGDSRQCAGTEWTDLQRWGSRTAGR
ncbi:unnamed protein product [Eretmochelys imbricata]